MNWVVFASTRPNACTAGYPATEGLPNCLDRMTTQDWLGGIAAAIGLVIALILLFAYLFNKQNQEFARQRSALYYQSSEYQAEFRRQRTAVFRIYGKQCCMCGSTDRIHVHHIVPRARGGSNDTSNLIPLCEHHHRMMHGGRG